MQTTRPFNDFGKKNIFYSLRCFGSGKIQTKIRNLTDLFVFFQFWFLNRGQMLRLQRRQLENT
jgi:hypothetical protein